MRPRVQEEFGPNSLGEDSVGVALVKAEDERSVHAEQGIVKAQDRQKYAKLPSHQDETFGPVAKTLKQEAQARQQTAKHLVQAELDHAVY